LSSSAAIPTGAVSRWRSVFFTQRLDKITTGLLDCVPQ